GTKGGGNGHPGAHRHEAPRPPRADTADLANAAGAAVRLRRLWSAGAVVVTLAERGGVLSDGVHPPLLVPTPFPARGDSCGAGDLGAAVVEAVRTAGGSPYVLDLKPPADPDVPYLPVDLSDTRAAERATAELAEQAQQRDGGLRGVVTAAGMDIPGPITGLT